MAVEATGPAGAQAVAWPLAARQRPPRPGWRRRPDHLWALAFILPYGAVFLAFAAYPILYGFWMARQPALYAELLTNPLYLRMATNTVLYVGVVVTVQMVLALLLSGFFMQRGWWRRTLLALFLLPWALPAVPAFLSFHWMLIGEWGLVDSALDLIGIDGPIWFNDRWLALGADIVAAIWKWLPFWTLILLAARMTIPQELYEAADIDGAAGLRRLLLFTLPLLAKVCLVCALLATLWTLGDFGVVYFVSGGAPAMSSEVLATASMRYAFDLARPELGTAVAISAVPVVIPLLLALLRALRRGEVQL